MNDTFPYPLQITRELAPNLSRGLWLVKWLSATVVGVDGRRSRAGHACRRACACARLGQGRRWDPLDAYRRSLL
jgi:hypothetical protein